MEVEEDSSVALNFLPLERQEFQFTVYRKECSQEPRNKPMPGEVYKYYSLPITDNLDERKFYRISFEKFRGAEKFLCLQDFNNWLTVYFLYCLLEGQGREIPEYLKDGKREFGNRVYFSLGEYKEGWQTVWLEPYYLRIEDKFGFLIDFRFIKKETQVFDRKVQQLSLSLDDTFRRNRSFYIDRYGKISSFIGQILPKLNPLRRNGEPLEIKTELGLLEFSSLSVKKYVFGDNQERNSQFLGLKEFGPLKKVEVPVKVLFVFSKGHKDFARDLFRALKGETYKNVFPGMEELFGIPFSKENVKGIEVSRVSGDEVTRILEVECLREDKKLVFPIVLVPSRADSNLYYSIKVEAARKNIACQNVTMDLLRIADELKWAVGSIGVQIFAKMGGIPWKVKPSNEKCLIVGIGQAHRKDSRGNVRRYFSYSVLTDSSGLFKDIKVLSSTIDPKKYLEELGQKLLTVIRERIDEFDKFVIHTPFKLKVKELKRIKDAIQEIAEEETGKEFAVIKVNTKNRFFAYYFGANSLIPYESTYVKLAPKEYLVWFEGLQYGKASVAKACAGPTHVEFYYESKELSMQERKAYLQDILNLSGANWRGFNAKALPVSIFYCKLLARFIREFEARGNEDVNIENFKPWFL